MPILPSRVLAEVSPSNNKSASNLIKCLWVSVWPWPVSPWAECAKKLEIICQGRSIREFNFKFAIVGAGGASGGPQPCFMYSQRHDHEDHQDHCCAFANDPSPCQRRPSVCEVMMTVVYIGDVILFSGFLHVLHIPIQCKRDSWSCAKMNGMGREFA